MPGYLADDYIRPRRRAHWLLPKAVPPGGCVGVFSPSEPLAKDRPDRLERSLEILRRAGFRIAYASHYLEATYYMAGSPEDRVDDIHELLLQDQVDLLLATWGGKGCSQLLPLIDYSLVVRARKPIMGFSDVCVLLNAIAAHTGLITFHGPNVAGKLDESRHADLAAVTSEDGAIALLAPVFGADTARAWETVRPGVARGRLFGGNLSTFVLGLVGSTYLQEMPGTVFFWESASEPPQLIDQYLTCLRNAGFFDHVTAMVVGDVRYEEEERKRRPLNDVLLSATSGYSFPIARIPTFGHARLENPIIAIGAMCRVDTGKRTAHYATSRPIAQTRA